MNVGTFSIFSHFNVVGRRGSFRDLMFVLLNCSAYIIHEGGSFPITILLFFAMISGIFLSLEGRLVEVDRWVVHINYSEIILI